MTALHERTAVGTVAPAGPIASVTPVDVVGCGVLSGAGIGLEPVAAALTVGAVPAPALLPEGTWPARPLLPVNDFDPVAVLGRKGLSRMTRTDQLVLAATAAAQDTVGPTDDPARTGLVVGTGTGSADAAIRFLGDTFVQERPYLVNPSHFPGTLMNSAAGQTAIRRELTGVNATLSGGPMASLHALRFAIDAIADGHADRLLTGGVEELGPAAAWAWHNGGALVPGAGIGEAAAIFVLDAPGSAEGPAPLGTLLTCEIGFADPVAGGLGAVSRRLTRCIEEALDRSGLRPGDVAVAVPGAGARRGWSAVEKRGLRDALGTDGPARTLRADAVFGESHSAGVAMQLACVLAQWGHGPSASAAADEQVALLTSVGFDGSVGCLVVRRARSARPPQVPPQRAASEEVRP